MNANQLMRMAMRMLANRGMNAGIKHLANRGRDPKDMTPQEREEARAIRQNTGKARRALNILRRFGRF